jgi:hypothetical protein
MIMSYEDDGMMMSTYTRLGRIERAASFGRGTFSDPKNNGSERSIIRGFSKYLVALTWPGRGVGVVSFIAKHRHCFICL